MNSEDKQKIDILCAEFISEVNIHKLLPKLLENCIFNRDDVNILKWQNELTDPETPKKICSMVKTRGPRAYENFVLSLRQSDHQLLLQRLNHSVSSNHGVRNSEWNSNSILKIEVKEAGEFLDGPDFGRMDRYRMRSRPRGLVLMITNVQFERSEYRTAATVDEGNLLYLFKGVGFEVIHERDLTSRRMMSTVKEFSENPKLGEVDSIFVVISSHGNGQVGTQVTEIQGTDYDTPNYTKICCLDILDQFTAENCPKLAGKPKIFLFQFCRGNEIQRAILRYESPIIEEEVEQENIEPIPFELNNRNYEDTLIVYATMPGFYSYRDREQGSWFIQKLCEVFAKHSYNTHVLDMINMIDREIQPLRTTKGNRCQTTWVLNQGFNKHCFLNPGLYEEGDKTKNKTADMEQ